MCGYECVCVVVCVFVFFFFFVFFVFVFRCCNVLGHVLRDVVWDVSVSVVL